MAEDLPKEYPFVFILLPSYHIPQFERERERERERDLGSVVECEGVDQ